MSEILYYNYPDMTEFEAQITQIEEIDGNISIILDRTAFYPEGGGQPADRGSINGISVIDVRKKNGTIYHIADISTQPSSVPAEGDKASCSIDTEHRFDYMQQHSGQHVISAAMMKVEGIGTVAVHQGEEFVAVETSAESISIEVIRAIEDEANASIRANAAITPEWTDAEGLADYNLRRPSKHSTDIRIINIAGIDCAACGGMHLHSTADIGLIKYSHQEKIRGHIRTFWKIGKRAYADYFEKTEIINSLNGMYSARQFELIEKAQAAAGSYSDLKYKYNKLEEDYASVFASSLVSENQSTAVVIKVFDEMSKDFIGSLLKALSAQNGSSNSFIFNRRGENLTWAVAAGENSDFSFAEFKTDLLPLIDGKGGGRAPLWQGAARNQAGLDDFIDKLKQTYM